MTISKTKLIADYLDAKSNFEKYKKLENTLRIKIVETIFPSAGEGTHNLEFGEVELKATVRYNYKFDQDQLKVSEEFFTDEERACVKRTPALNVALYKDLSPMDKGIIDDAVIITPGLPTLTIKELA